MDPTVVHAERPVGILATAAPGAATAIVNLGKALTEWADTAAALDTGSIGVGHAKVIVGFFARLPDGVPAEALPECETYLLQAAAGENPAELARRAAALRHLLEPIQDSLPDAENTDLNELFAATTLGGRGMVKADLDAEMLHAALSALSKPQPGEDGARDTRSPALRRAEAFAELLRRHLNHGDNPVECYERPRVSFLIREEDLTAAEDTEPPAVPGVSPVTANSPPSASTAKASRSTSAAANASSPPDNAGR